MKASKPVNSCPLALKVHIFLLTFRKNSFPFSWFFSLKDKKRWDFYCVLDWWCSAALNLGCVPERTSRSQRNSNTRSYLSPRNQAPDAKSPKTIDTRNQIQISTSGPSFYPPLMENQASVASSSVYPLYYGVHFQPRNPITGFQTTHEDSNRIIVGKPVFQTVHERLAPSIYKFL